MTRLAGAFEEPCLVGYLVGCHPDRETFLAHASALIDNGCKVLEIGIPFSDPVADGPTIQDAVKQALDAGVRPRDVLDACAELRERHPDTPMIVMTYANIAHAMGYETFADRLREAGLDGAILADMPPEASHGIQDAFGDELDQVFLAAPSSTDDRLDHLMTSTRGFLYLVGLFGVTGARDEIDPRTVDLVQRVAPRAHQAGTPVAVGFGISHPDHARQLVAAGADGIVVGSAFVTRITDGRSPKETGALAAELAQGVADGAADR